MKLHIWIICCATLFLVGCGSNTPTDMIRFANFSLEIDADFEQVPAGVVENKQILNKVIASYKKDTDNGFDTNIIITTSDLPPQLDYEQFRTINTNKLKQYVKSYTPDHKQLMSFACGDEDIQGIYVRFSVKDSFVEAQRTYYMEQYQFVYKDTGYIIAYATADEQQWEWFQKKLDTLTCSTPTT